MTIARAMYFKTKVLILDEPTNHLSIKETNKVLGWVEGLKAQGITSVLHEKKGGYANNKPSIYKLASKAQSQGVRIETGVTVTGFSTIHGSGGAIRGVETDHGLIECDYVIVAVGPWINQLWKMLDLPATITIKGTDGVLNENVGMWVFWSLQEGTLGVGNVGRAHDCTRVT